MSQDIRGTVCASPWFHMQILPQGNYSVCRWSNITAQANIRDTEPLEFFREHMAPFRRDLLAGVQRPECHECRAMEAHGKVSGRQRQMIKVGMWPEAIETSIKTSTFWTEFLHSADHAGATDCLPQDWQIEMGNYCNSACLFCRPDYSSRIATEHRRLGWIQQVPKNWTDDPELVDRFLDTLLAAPSLRYLHFLGGETLIMPAFEQILAALHHHGHADTHLGFTTNLTVWPQSVLTTLEKFHHVHVNVSLESLGRLNDYVRWPSDISVVRRHLDQWKQLCDLQGWWLTLRVTPTLLTVHELVSVYDYAWQQSLPVEACNFLEKPEYMRATVLPRDLRLSVATTLKNWIQDHVTDGSSTVYNTRNPAQVHQHLLEDAASYVNYLERSADESHRLPELARYLRTVDSHRGNSVLDYLPQYADILRAAGY